MTFPLISPSHEADTVSIDGYIGIASDGYTVANSDVKGANKTAPVFVSTGIYTITLDRVYEKFLFAKASLDLATPICLVDNWHPDNNKPVSKLTLTLVNTSSAAANPGTAGAIHVHIKLRRSSVGT